MAFGKCAPFAAFSGIPLLVLALSTASAVETLDDTGLAAASGRDGIAIALDVDLTTDIVIHDTDGINVDGLSGYGYAGAVVIQDLSINATNGTADIADGILIRLAFDDRDADAPALDVDLHMPGTVIIETGTLGMANSRRDGGAGRDARTVRGIDGAVTAPWMDSAQIILGGARAHLRLAREGEGARIALYAELINGVVINNIAINDVTSGGSIGADQITLVDTGGKDLTVRAGLTVTGEGEGAIELLLTQIGSFANSIDVSLKRLYLGSVSAGYIGDIDILGLSMNGTTVAVRSL